MLPMKLFAKFLPLCVFLLSMPSFCVVYKKEGFSDFEYIAQSLIKLLIDRGVAEKVNGEVVPGVYPNPIYVEEVGLACHRPTGRFFVDISNSFFRGHLSSRNFYPGEVFEFKQGEMVSMEEYVESNGLYKNSCFEKLNLGELTEIFTIEKSEDARWTGENSD